MEDFVSGSYKANPQSKIEGDTRNNWLEFMFVSHCRYNMFGKQSTIDACTRGFRELEAFGFEFGTIGFGGTHVHGHVNVPKKYSYEVAEIMLKSHSAKRIFSEKPNFRKLYPDGHFWSGYEHHQSVGKDMESRKAYVKSQSDHHNVKIIDDRQKTISHFTNNQLTKRRADTPCS